MFVCTIGDAVVDVVVELSRLPVVGDDVPGRISLSNGGQASNVAAWCSALGARAAVLSNVGADLAGDLVAGLLLRYGVELLGPGQAGGEASTGTIVSLVTPGGERSMVSDRGAAARLRASDVQAAWFRGCDWLHVSGYSLFGADDGEAALVAADLAHRVGATVSVDVSAATLVESIGAAESIRRIRACSPNVVFSNEAERRAVGHIDGTSLVVKLGRNGFVLQDDSGERSWAALDAETVRDTTGAGDAFAAGWIVGGPELARMAAQACLGEVGAMPRLDGPLRLGADGMPPGKLDPSVSSRSAFATGRSTVTEKDAGTRDAGTHGGY